jgi:hypothetical protein
MTGEKEYSVMSTPRAFISHASEDKAGYAEPLARELLAKGIDVWLDKWEIAPGDSLVHKIFHQAMAETDAVVVILSKTSVRKPWVEKELDVAVVRNIQKLSRLIPVRIDDCEVPESLRDQLWVDWGIGGGVVGVAKRIVDALFEHSSKPAIGQPPRYLQDVDIQIPGLTTKDILVLRCIYEFALGGHRKMIQFADYWPAAEAKELSEEDVIDATDVLASSGYLLLTDGSVRGNGFLAELPPKLVLQFAATDGHDIASIGKQVASLILNEGVVLLDDLVERTGVIAGIVEAIVCDFQQQGFLKTFDLQGRTHQVWDMTAIFRRWFAEG